MSRSSPIWYPTRASLRFDHETMTWTDLSGISFDEPFFHKTVKRAFNRTTLTLPIGTQPTTNLAAVAEPTAFIFHVSRCGSTLLCNILRALGNAHVVAEAQPFTALLAPVDTRHHSNQVAEQTQQRHALLRQVALALGQSPSSQKTTYIIKCTSYSAMRLDLIRAIWPMVPIVFLTRDPVEVIVSNMRRPPGWISAWKDPRQAASVFGWSEDTINLSQEAYFARSFGSICQAALTHLGTPSLVLDYHDLSHHDGWRKVLAFLGIDAPDAAAQIRLSSVLRTNAKSNHGKSLFSPDAQEKRSKASELVQEAANHWAYPPLHALLANHPLSKISK
jgi:hypothetical protein